MTLTEDHLKWLRIETNTLKKMRAEGVAEGEARGKAERDIEIAKNLLIQNIPLDTISKATGLSIPDVQKIQGK
ncbi:hypothetical protein OAP56_02535 [Rickettsiaceae bacterium]|nr:hypothetical protein [Rickettsiaceae bacterium]